MEHAAVEVDIAAIDGGMHCRAANRRVTSAGVEPDQNEASKMPAGRSPRDVIAHDLTRPPCRPQEPRGLAPREPSIACRAGFLRQHDLDDLGAQPFPTMMIDSRAKVFQLTPGGGLCHPLRRVAG